MKEIVYYTDNRLDEKLMSVCQKQLKKSNLPIISVSLKPIEFGKNFVLNLERGYLTMFKQILKGLEESTADIIYFCEHDVLYHPCHFDFTPLGTETYYYNHNNWKVRHSDGQALYYTCEQTLGLCAYRDVLLDHYRERVRRVELEGFDRRMGFEPGKHRPPVGVDSQPWDWWMSPVPNIDIRHNLNLTKNRWSQDEFRDKRNCKDWIESNEVPGWGITKNRFNEILNSI